MKRIVSLLFLLAAASASAADGTLQFANLGDFKLDSGQIVRHCRIGYRTYGQLTEDRSNVIVALTWFGGSTQGLAAWIGPSKLYDSSKFFVVAIDALGDGVSSSPSNNAGMPPFTIRDMVHTQHEVLTRVLNVHHVYAVSGLSMGGMQAFQWAVSYPDFMDAVIPIVGTPKLTSYDLLLWKTELSLLGSPLGMKAAADINEMHLHTPAWIVEHASDIDAVMRSHEEALRKIDVNDYASQLRAMIAHDIGSPAAIRAKMLIVVSEQDHMVNPAPARELAAATKSELLILTGDCGHLATSCEQDKLVPAVAKFLAR